MKSFIDPQNTMIFDSYLITCQTTEAKQFRFLTRINSFNFNNPEHIIFAEGFLIRFATYIGFIFCQLGKQVEFLAVFRIVVACHESFVAQNNTLALIF